MKLLIVGCLAGVATALLGLVAIFLFMPVQPGQLPLDQYDSSLAKILPAGSPVP